jgi:adenosine/AMP kinase
MGEVLFQLTLVQIENPDELNFILGQSHFIKTVEDIHEAVVTSVPGAQFGLAFCESSGLALVRSTGTDNALKALAERNALAIGAGHCFILFLRDAYPINVLNAIKLVPEVANIYCATANPVQVILAESEQGRGILGVIDGIRTKGIEDADGVAWREGFLRKIGYKLGA